MAISTISIAAVSAAASAQDVDLAKRPFWGDSAWIGAPVSSVLAVADIERIVLLRAMTNPTADIDVRNIRRMLETDAVLQPLSDCGSVRMLSDDDRMVIWDAVVLMNSGATIRFQADGEWVRLIWETGGGCYLEVKTGLMSDGKVTSPNTGN